MIPSPGPGARDDGHSVAVQLETLRALLHSPCLHNDVVFLWITRPVRNAY